MIITQPTKDIICVETLELMAASATFWEDTARIFKRAETDPILADLINKLDKFYADTIAGDLHAPAKCFEMLDVITQHMQTGDQK